jgi:hypothetical protein
MWRWQVYSSFVSIRSLWLCVCVWGGGGVERGRRTFFNDVIIGKVYVEWLTDTWKKCVWGGVERGRRALFNDVIIGKVYVVTSRYMKKVCVCVRVYVCVELGEYSWLENTKVLGVSHSLSTTNPLWTGLGSTPAFREERPRRIACSNLVFTFRICSSSLRNLKKNVISIYQGPTVFRVLIYLQGPYRIILGLYAQFYEFLLMVTVKL